MFPNRVPFDAAAYDARVRAGPCFICGIINNTSPELREANVIVHSDDEVLVLLNRYPTLRGYTLVCPRRHVERVLSDFTAEEYLSLQRWIYRVGRAIEAVVPTERLYVLSLGSQQGNRHVHWHLAPLPPGVPYAEQQLAALSLQHGMLDIPRHDQAALAAQLREHILGAPPGGVSSKA
jgi:diadenosine tetraphosphate (Ap4A) HIT family hydrolase